MKEGQTICKTSGKSCRENAKACPAVIARSACDEAIHLSAMPRHGLLRYARNDVDRPRRTESPPAQVMAVVCFASLAMKSYFAPYAAKNIRVALSTTSPMRSAEG